MVALQDFVTVARHIGALNKPTALTPGLPGSMHLLSQMVMKRKNVSAS